MENPDHQSFIVPPKPAAMTAPQPKAASRSGTGIRRNRCAQCTSVSAYAVVGRQSRTVAAHAPGHASRGTTGRDSTANGSNNITTSALR